jgi:uncharacterized protein GlcG (DUF336 family)
MDCSAYIYLKNKIGGSLMNKHKGFEIVGLFAALALSASSAFAQELTPDDCQTILNNAETAANATDSAFRPDPDTTRMHIICMNRNGRILGRRSMADAWVGSLDIARAKAFTGAVFSSNRNALSTRGIGCLSQPGGALWQIGNSNRPNFAIPLSQQTIKMRGLIEFPGGLPLYRGGELVGGIGVSGDGVDQDEDVAKAGAVGFEPDPAIRSDTVLGLPYTDDPCPTP